MGEWLDNKGKGISGHTFCWRSVAVGRLARTNPGTKGGRQRRGVMDGQHRLGHRACQCGSKGNPERLCGRQGAKCGCSAKPPEQDCSFNKKMMEHEQEYNFYKENDGARDKK
eukprot:1144838-Pelagomonas_calceolata.AAC.2